MMVVAPVLLLALLAIAPAVGLLIFTRRGVGRTAVAGPVCGACGYSTVGLSKMTCPECGGDLRAVGILTARTPRRTPGVVVGLFLYTPLLGLVAVVTTIAAVSLLPVRRSYRQQVRLVTPKSGAYQEVGFRTEASTWGAEPMLLPVEIELLPKAAAQATAAPAAQTQPVQSARMTVRPDGTYEYTAGGGARVAGNGRLNAAAVLDWIAAAGVDTSQPAVREEAARIAGEARLVARGGPRVTSGEGLRAGGYSSSSSGGDSGGQFDANSSTERADARPPYWAVAPFAVFWFVVWVLGLRHLATRAVPGGMHRRDAENAEKRTEKGF